MSQTILYQSALSKEYVRVPVAAAENGIAVNPTTDTVQMAFPTHNAAITTWYSATWESAGSTYYARTIVGPGGSVALTAGRYDVWVKVTDSPEIPARKAGQLIIQ
jgi:hypothetical protein